MSDNNAKFSAIQTNEVTRVNESSNSPWVVGISKSHPGQRYFFNTVTGVSLWHISSEEMEISPPQQRPNGIQSQYINCPEPKEPPPNRRSLIKHCQHTEQCPKIVSRDVAHVFPKHLSGITCEVCCSPVNQSSLHFRQRVGNPECPLLLNNTPQSQVASTACSSLNILSCESNFGCSKTKHSLERKTYSSDEHPEITDQDPIYHEDMANQSNNDRPLETSTHLEMLDVSPLKVLAKSGCIDDKWYIVADVSVYLHSLHFLRTVLNSDQQCCLMVPQYVKVELENATKLHQKTKAYCANYFLYKLLDDGVAQMDGDTNLQLNKDKLDKESLINCCIKLANQNFFVILITNDIQLKKYRLKINIPVFTVKELKDYLCRNSYLMETSSPESSLIVPHSKKIKVISQCATTANTCNLNDTTVRNKYNVVKQDQNIQKSLNLYTTNEQFGNKHVTKRTAEAAVQTDLSLTQLAKMENVYKQTNLSDQSGDKVSEKESGSLLSCTNQSRKHIKLRRRKVTNQPVSASPVSSSETQSKFNTVDVLSSCNNLLQSKDLGDVNQNSQNTLLTSMSENNETYAGDKSKNTTNCYLEPLLHDRVQNQSSNNSEIANKSFEKANNFIEKSETFENENVMFEVNNAIMEENLKIRCDEWVSRFVQIMEEALTQVLRKTSSLYLPPPWNMYEATACIGQKYKDDADVSNASTKLLNVLNCISDVKGNSNANISPTKFMELYSFGVYLIDALQGILNNCEDLQIAAGSLTKLLSDIQNPESDLSNLESFHDMSQEGNVPNDNEYSSNKLETEIDTENNSSVRHTVNIEDLPENNIDEIGQTINPTVLSYENVSLENIRKSNASKNNAIENENQLKACNIQGTLKTNTVTEKSRSPNNESVTSLNSYSLRSLKSTKTITTQEQEKLDKKHSQQSCRKSLFLSNLLLQENRDLPRNSVSNNDLSSENKECSEKLNNVSNVNAKINTSSNEPKIIRNFVVCSEFENRLRGNQIQDGFDDYDFDEDEMEVDYDDVDDFSSNKSKVDVAEFTEFHNHIYHPVEKDVNCNKDVIKIYFRCFIKRIAQEIRDISTTVYNFSTNYCDDISSEATPVDKNDVREKAEQTHLYIDKVCTALSRFYTYSILRRDKDFNYNLKAVLNKTEFGNFYVDEDQMDVYGVFIESCLKQAYDLKRIIEDILSSVQE